MNPKLIRISFFFFFVVAFLGVVMRLAPFLSIPISYDHLLHAHSHIAFQGWVYLSFFFLIVTNYINPTEIANRKYTLQFILTALVLIGVLVSFLIQGYGLFSILFSSLFQFLSYWFIVRFFIDVRKNITLNPLSLSLKFIKTGLVFYIISSMAPWLIGTISAKGLAGSELYHSAIYLFLHFQFNGFFTFAALGLFIHQLEKEELLIKNNNLRVFFHLLTLSIVPAYFLSLLGMSFRSTILSIAYFSSIVQLAAVIYFILGISPFVKKVFKNNTPLTHFLGFIFISSFILKTLLQSFSILDTLEQIAFTNRNIIMAFIHLTLIGFIAFSLLFLFKSMNILKPTFICNSGLFLIIMGFITSEIFLVVNGLGIAIQNPTLLLLTFSALILLGVGLILVSLFKK